MMYDIDGCGCETLAHSLLNVKSSRGVKYQVQIIIIKDEFEFNETSLDDMRISDGELKAE